MFMLSLTLSFSTALPVPSHGEALGLEEGRQGGGLGCEVGGPEMVGSA